MESQENFNNNFSDLIWERINYAWNKGKDTPEQDAAGKKANNLMDTIKALLTEENKKLILALEVAITYKESFTVEAAYRQGLADAELFKGELSSLIKAS